MAQLTMTEESSTPSTPGANKWTLYFKPDGVYILDDAGTAIGPFVTGNGWVTDVNTWSYSSADSPTFVISINADMTAILRAGMRIKLTQTTTKYFIVTAVGSYSGGATLVTVYGGTDYTLANAAISNPYYSNVKAPFGFPITPDKWTVTYSNSSDAIQASPGSGTWYNPSSQSITIPIGFWRIEMEYLLQTVATVTGSSVATLSTANNSESNTAYSFSWTILTTGTNRIIVNKLAQYFNLASKTTYYLNCKVNQASQTSVGFLNSSVPTTIRAVCVYL